VNPCLDLPFAASVALESPAASKMMHQKRDDRLALFIENFEDKVERIAEKIALRIVQDEFEKHHWTPMMLDLGPAGSVTLVPPPADYLKNKPSFCTTTVPNLDEIFGSVASEPPPDDFNDEGSNNVHKETLDTTAESGLAVGVFPHASQDPGNSHNRRDSPLTDTYCTTFQKVQRSPTKDDSPTSSHDTVHSPMRPSLLLAFMASTPEKTSLAWTSQGKDQIPDFPTTEKQIVTEPVTNKLHITADNLDAVRKDKFDQWLAEHERMLESIQGIASGASHKGLLKSDMPKRLLVTCKVMTAQLSNMDLQEQWDNQTHVNDSLQKVLKELHKHIPTNPLNFTSDSETTIGSQGAAPSHEVLQVPKRASG